MLSLLGLLKFSEEVLLLLTPIRKNFLIENLALVLLPGFDFGLSTVLWARTAVKFVTDAELVTDMSSHSFTDSTTVIITINGSVTGEFAGINRIVWEAVTAGFTGRVSITFVGGGDLGRAGSFCIVSVFCSKLPSGSALPSGSPCNSRDFSVISFSLTVKVKKEMQQKSSCGEVYAAQSYSLPEIRKPFVVQYLALFHVVVYLIKILEL
ncbi:hypothetical protein GQX74_006988 [Glossina fuscipes]|nr:hypothetical protein GQX74_006988 [Glossina fuscipes]